MVGLLVEVMRLFSQKTRERNIKTLFRALKLELWCFVCAFKKYITSILFFANSASFNTRSRLSRFVLLTLSICAVLSVSQFIFAAQIQDGFRPASELINVFPSEISSSAWHNIETINVQDLNEQSLFQDFNKENSAYIDSSDSIDQFRSDTQTVNPSSGSQGTEQAAETIGNNDYQNSELVDTVEVSPTATDELLPAIEETTPAIEPSPEPVVPSEPAPSTETTSLETMLGQSSYLSFFKQAAGEFLFAQAETTEPIAPDAVEPEPGILESAAPEQEVAPLGNPEPVVAPVETVTGETRPIDVVEPTIGESTPILDENATVPVTEQIPTVRKTTLDSYELTLRDFGIPKLAGGQFIDNLQLRLSLAGQYDMSSAQAPAFISIDYLFGEFSRNAGSILIEGEASNALNGGYYLIPLPSVTDPKLLSDLTIKISVTGDAERLQSLYIDSAWLEVGTVVFDEGLLKERFSPTEMLKHLEGPQNMELLSDRLDFNRDELPQFNLRYNSQRNFIVQAWRNLFGEDLATIESVEVVHNEGEVVEVSPDVTITPEGLISVILTEADKEQLLPGIYSIALEIDEGGYISIDTFEFQWGLLSINSNQTTYQSNDIAEISMGALSPNGNTLCDAKLNLYISDPNGFISSTPVITSGQCNGNNVIDAPDYSSQFVTGTPGQYEMYLERVDDLGNVISHSMETFFVVAEQSIVIERNGPTRIYPPAPYAMELTINARTRSFDGELIERVPNSFVIFNTDAEIRPQAGYTELVWNMSMLAGTSQTVSYSFDAPDISPYLYELGPAQLVSSVLESAVEETVVVPPTTTEPQVDTTLPSETEALPPPIKEVVPQPEPVETVPEPVPEAVPTAEIPVLETATETPPIPVPEETVVSPEVTPPTEAPVDVVVPTELTPVTVENTKTEELSYGAIFKRAIGNFLFAQAETIDPITPALTNEVLPVNTVLPVSTTTGGVTEAIIEPVVPIMTSNVIFIEHRQWQIASDATGNMLLYWDGTNIPSGWTCVSCAPTDVFYQRFIQGSSTAGTNGGVATHTHSASGAASTSASSTSINSGGGGATNVPTVAHAHTYTPTISTDNNLPAYRELAVIQYNSVGSPPTIPAGAIAIFDATVPSGWTQYSAQDGKYIRGASTSTAGTASSSNTHTHNITGNLLGTANFTTATAGDNLVNTASAAHTHAINTTTGSVNHEPPYREAILGKLTATSSPSDAMIAMWTDTQPLGWNTVSSASEPFENRFVKASTTYGGTGGATTSTHTNLTSITSQGPSGTQTRDLVTIDNTVTTNAHTHNVSVTNFSTVTTLPPYRTAIFAKRTVGGAEPIAPTVHVLFDNEKTGTSTPIFEFTAEDADGADTLVYQFQWDDDKDIATSPTGDRISDDESGCSPNCFSNTASSTDTNPFTDNERIRFTIQTPLTTGVTYYWRVRAKETIGGVWGAWSTIQSITYESGTDPSVWYQTEGTQFEVGTLSNVATTSGTVVALATATSTITNPSAWAQQYANTAYPAGAVNANYTISAGTNRVLLVAIGSTRDTVGTQSVSVTYGGQALTMATGDDTNATNPNHTYFFYLKESGITAATGTSLNVTVTGGTSVYTFVYASVWAGVDQTSVYTDVRNYFSAVASGTVGPFAAGLTVGTGDQAIEVINLARSASGAAARTVTTWSNATWSSTVATTYAPGAGYAMGFHISNRNVTTSATEASGHTASSANTLDSMSGISLKPAPPATLGTIMSPEVDFDWVSGQTDWGDISWNTTEPSGTDSLLRVYYSSTTACDTIIPEGVLSGNGAGFNPTDTGLLINQLSTTTYNRICLQMTLDQGTGTTSPTLNDWTVNWVAPNQPPNTPLLGETPAFDNIKATTTQPTFGGFSATDIDGDALEYELIVDDNPDFSSPVFTKQSSNYPTDAGWTGATFASGATTTYTVQSGDALTEGTTYWWTVRTRDPLGTNTWTATSTARSMTISTLATVAEWYQTTGHQFENGTLVDTSTTSSGVELTDLSFSANPITTQSAWAQQYANGTYPAGTVNASYSIAAGTNRVLVVAIASTRSVAGTQSVGVYYGGKPLTLATGDATNATNVNHTYLYYLNDADITAATTTVLNVQITGGTSYYTFVYASVFANVDQTSIYTDAQNYFSGATANATVGPFASGLTIGEGDQAIEIVNLARSAVGNAVRTVSTWSNTSWPNPSTVAATVVPATNWGVGLHINNRNATSSGTESSGHTASSANTQDSMSGISLKVAAAGSAGTVMSPEVDHDWVPNQSTWGEVAWNVSEPSSSDTLLHLYYSSTTACDTLILDGVLPGNSAGFDASESPLDISALSTTTYNRICLKAELLQGSALTSPTLNDWTVRWVLTPQFVQSDYRWYVNLDSLTPTDPWPVGGVDLIENEAIDVDSGVLGGANLRLRMALTGTSTNAAVGSASFKLQFAEGVTCSADLSWQDVGDTASTTALWRGYNNASIADATILPSTLLTNSNVLETYEERNN